MFQEMTEHLTCEIKTLYYPRAAVFAFCLAIMAWDGMSVVHAALRSVYGEETVEENLSGDDLSLESFQKQFRGPKKPQPARHYSGNGKHVATAELLARRNH